jgi:hypothetical protein
MGEPRVCCALKSPERLTSQTLLQSGSGLTMSFCSRRPQEAGWLPVEWVRQECGISALFCHIHVWQGEGYVLFEESKVLPEASFLSGGLVPPYAGLLGQSDLHT